MVDALSRRHVLFSKLGAQILGFDNIRELYKDAPRHPSSPKRALTVSIH